MKGFLKVLGKSAVKGLKTVGVTAAAGALAALAQPEVLVSLAAPAGLYAPAVVLILTGVLRTAQDAIKHRDKMVDSPE